MISLDTLRAEVAREIDPAPFACLDNGCTHHGCGWRRHNALIVADAAIAIVLRAVADGLAIRRDGYSGDDTASFGARVALHVASHDIETLALAAGGGR